MEQGSSRFDWARLVAGIAILAVGVLLFMDTSGLSRGWELWDFWPLILVAVGITRLVNAVEANQRQSALFIAFLGCWLLIASLGFFGLDYGDSWPLVLVAIGLSILLTAWSFWRAAKGLFLVFLGAWLQATTLGLFGLTLHTTWPFVIVILGLGLVVSSFFPERVHHCQDRECCKQEGAS